MATYIATTAFIPTFLDDNGNLLSGGTLESYIAGTTTPTRTYTGESGVSAGDIITLNARGEPETSGNAHQVWIDGAIKYDFILKDASGVTINSPEDVSSVLLDSVASTLNIASAKALTTLTDGQSIYIRGYTTAGDGGGGMYVYDAASTATANGGTVLALDTLAGRLVHAEITPVTVKTFGAVGDGVTDDTAAIQAAIDSLPQPSGQLDYAISKPDLGGGLIGVPRGKYIVTDLGLYEYISLTGDGSGATVIVVSGSVTWTRRQVTTFDVCWGIKIKGITFRGAAGTEVLMAAGPYVGAKSFTGTPLLDSYFEDVEWTNSLFGFSFSGGWNNVFNRCSFRNSNVGLDLKANTNSADPSGNPAAYCDDNTFIDCEFNNCDTSTRLRHAVGNRFITCPYYSAGIRHVLISDQSIGNVWEGGRLEQSKEDLVRIEGGDTVTHNGTSYRCIAAHTSGSTNEPGVGASWATYWVVYGRFPAYVTWATGLSYLAWEARNNQFKSVNLFVGADPYFGRDGVSIPQDVGFTFAVLSGDQHTLFENCFSGNTVDKNFTLNDLSVSAKLINNTNISAVVASGSPSYYERTRAFDALSEVVKSGTDAYDGGNVEYNYGSAGKLTIQKATGPNRLQFLIDSFGEAMSLSENNKSFTFGANQSGTATAAGSTTNTIVSVPNASASQTVVVSAKNASAAALGVVYAALESDDKIRITHSSAAGGELFDWQIM